jgi:hypothetical protein
VGFFLERETGFLMQVSCWGERGIERGIAKARRHRNTLGCRGGALLSRSNRTPEFLSSFGAPTKTDKRIMSRIRKDKDV